MPVDCNELASPDAGAVDKDRPTAFLLHGYMGHWRKPWTQAMALRLHSFLNLNVCIVDWSTLAALELALSVLKLPDLGHRIAECVTKLLGSSERDLDNVSLIGFGLGAHLAGCVGKNLRGRAGRIFGLDPLIEFSEHLRSSEYRLVASDAQLVQVAHTSIGSYGAYRPSGHQDFYFNDGGRSPQPGCGHLADYQRGACSHFRAVEYLFHSINETNKFYDTKRQERFGYMTVGKSGSYLIRTTKKPPYSY